MRLGRILLIVAVLLLVILAMIFALTNLTGGGDSEVDVEATQLAALQPVVMMSEDVARGEAISANQLEIVRVPAGETSEFTFSEIIQVEGLFARIDLEAGQYVELTYVTDNPLTLMNELGSSHAALIPAGMVAFPIPISRFSSLAYGLARGDHVNVIATIAFVDLDSQFQSVLPNSSAGILGPDNPAAIGSIRPEDAGQLLAFTNEFVFWNNIVAQSITGGAASPQGRAELDSLLNQPFYIVPSQPQRARVVSQTVMFNKVVLHMGDFPFKEEKDEVVVPVPEEPQDPNDPNQPPPEPEILPPDIITLIVSPQESVALNYMLYTGAELTLALRSKGDEAVLPTDAVTIQYLMDVYRIPLPIKLPYGTQPGIDILEPPVLLNDVVEEPQQ